MKPIIPFEPVSTRTIPEGGNWISQIKWDGVRMVTYFDGYKVQLINRKLNERTMQYPELLSIQQYCSAQSVILDGEIVAFDRGRPSFHEIMRRDSARKPDTITQAAKLVPITYVVFDILYYNGNWVTNRSLEERQLLLSQCVSPNANIHIAENFRNGEQLFTVMKEHEMEGIVCKDLSSTYAVNGKDSRWQKKKIIRDLIAVVGGATFRDGRVNALLLGIYNKEGDLIYIGHAGTGKLTEKDWQTVTKIVNTIRIDKNPFRNTPERSKNVVWVQPVLKVKVNYLEWTVHHTLRQPSIQAFVE